MSMLSKYVGKQIKKYGLKKFILKVLDIVTELTPSKEDDKILEEIKKVLNQFD